MASTMNLMCLMFFLILIGKGMCFQLCPNNGVIIDQDRTGKVVQGMPEWWLRLSPIDCPCPQIDVKLACPGFQPEVGPDPSIFKKDGDICIIVPPVGPNPVTVTYVDDIGYPFSLHSSSSKCYM